MQNLKDLLTDIHDRAEHECETARRTGNKQGNYVNIKIAARNALKELRKLERGRNG